MSLLTKISKLFAKQQANQSIGIALQQGALTACFTQAEKQPVTDDNMPASQSTFQTAQVDLSDYAKTISSLQASNSMAGKCHLVLNTKQSQIVQVDKPNVPEDEIVAALKWQVKDLVTIPPENMVVDYFDGPILAGGKEKIHVVCSPLNELKKLVEAVKQTDAEVASIITEEFAFANLLPIQNEACLLVCQQPNEEITLIIVKQGQLYFYRRLHGFNQIANKSEDELVTTMIDNLALEIQRSSDYFERQLRQAPIKEIAVILPMATESFFARKLAESTHIPVNLLTLPEGYQQHREYASAIGASMFDTQLAQLEQWQAQEAANVS